MNASAQTALSTPPRLLSDRPRASGSSGAVGRSLLLALMAIAFVGLVTTTPAVAQMLPESAPPEVRFRNPPPVWVGYLVMFLLAAVVVTLSLMPSKRSHQD